MNGEQEQVFAWRQAQESRAHQRSRAKINGLLDLLAPQMRGKISSIGKIARVQTWQLEDERWSNQLTELAAFVIKCGAERFVTRHNFIQRSPEHELIERPVPTQGE